MEQVQRDKIIQGVLEEFEAMCRIPHGSDNEEAVCEYLCRRLGELGYKAMKDESLNVTADVPATAGMEHLPVVMLQAHMDMVVATKGEEFDPATDPVITRVDGDMLCTDGRSSLGADNGIGLAAVLYLLRCGDTPHGPLRILFTSGEEVGLKGARQLSADVFEGASYLINLDGFHSDRAIVGCMGGKREVFRHNIRTFPVPEGCAGLEVEVSGMRGGHSGEDIASLRCNAIRLLAELLESMWVKGHKVGVSAINGGTAANVIPRSCSAHLVVRRGELESVMEECRKEFEWVTAAYGQQEDRAHLEVREIPVPDVIWTRGTFVDVLETISEENNGVYAMSHQFGGCVGGSSNLGLIVTGEKEVEIHSMIRCESGDVEEELLHQHQHTAEEHGFDIKVSGYNAWHQDADNPLTRAVQKSYLELNGTPITVTIAPVGLEPASFQEKAPWLRIVTLGADIFDAHATTERVRIPSIASLYCLIVATLENIGG